MRYDAHELNTCFLGEHNIVIVSIMTYLHLHFRWRENEPEGEDTFKILHRYERLKDGPTTHGLTLGGVQFRSTPSKKINED